MAYIYDLTDTWSAAGTVFNGIKLNVTNTASAAASKLITLQIGGTEHFSVTKAGVGYFSGNVGIGTTSPASKLDVRGVITGGDGTIQTVISYLAAAGVTGTLSNHPYVLYANNAERMRIDASGNVGVGTSSPFDKLHVEGNTLLSWGADNKFWMAFSNDYRMGMRLSSDTRSATIFATGPAGDGGSIRFNTRAATASGATDYGLERMRIDSSGNVGVGTSTPARTLSVYSASSIPAQIESSGTDARISIFTSSGSGGQGFVQASSGALLLGSSNTERMRINSSGLVGIGTSSPQVGVHVSFADQSTNRIRLQNTGSGGGNFDIVGGLAGASNAGLSFFDVTNSATRMYIDSSGRVLIGTTATVGGTWSNEVKQTSSGVWPWGLNCVDRGLIVRNSSTSTGYYAYFEYNGGTNNGSISWSGGTTAYNTTSDARIKDNIVDAPDAGDLIDAIQVRSWDFKADGAHWRYGMVAQELLEVAPEAVNKPEDEEMMMGVDYSKLVPMLIKEVQSLRARVAQLEGN